MTKNDILGIAVAIGAVYGIYKLTTIMIEADKEAEVKRAEFEKFVKDELALKDYKVMIRKASIFNDKLDPHQRNLANDILIELYNSVKNSSTYDEFEDRLDKLEDMLSLFSATDDKAMQAVLERRLQIEESRKIKAQRQHELALAKAAGESEIEIAKISANAEKAKAQLYSNGIRNAASIITEVTNEHKQ